MTVLKSDFVPLSKAVKILGVSPSTLYRYEKAGLLKAYRTAGGHRRYLVSELTSFLEKMESGDFPNQRSAAQFSLRKECKR
jgi:hypothetical protein